jgi:ankyrin repeat protein
VVELLLASKADVNAKASIGWTPLHFAAMRCHRDVVELLLASKADVNAEDGGGGTPLRDAARNCNDVTELLRQHGGHD